MNRKEDGEVGSWGTLNSPRALTALPAPTPHQAAYPTVLGAEQDPGVDRVETGQGLLHGGGDFLGRGTPRPRPGRRTSGLLRLGARRKQMRLSRPWKPREAWRDSQERLPGRDKPGRRKHDLEDRRRGYKENTPFP